jgi:hypothetical protein
VIGCERTALKGEREQEDWRAFSRHTSLTSHHTTLREHSQTPLPLPLQVPHHPGQPAQARGEGLQDPGWFPLQLHHLRQLLRGDHGVGLLQPGDTGESECVCAVPRRCDLVCVCMCVLSVCVCLSVSVCMQTCECVCERVRTRACVPLAQPRGFKSHQASGERRMQVDFVSLPAVPTQAAARGLTCRSSETFSSG